MLTLTLDTCARLSQKHDLRISDWFVRFPFIQQTFRFIQLVILCSLLKIAKWAFMPFIKQIIDTDLKFDVKLNIWKVDWRLKGRLQNENTLRMTNHVYNAIHLVVVKGDYKCWCWLHVYVNNRRQIKNWIETMSQLSSENSLSYGIPHFQVYHMR